MQVDWRLQDLIDCYNMQYKDAGQLMLKSLFLERIQSASVISRQRTDSPLTRRQEFLRKANKRRAKSKEVRLRTLKSGSFDNVANPFASLNNVVFCRL